LIAFVGGTIWDRVHIISAAGFVPSVPNVIGTEGDDVLKLRLQGNFIDDRG
jgi:hypothetical protein